MTSQAKDLEAQMAAAAEWAEANKKLEHSVAALQSDKDAETAARAEMESTVGDLQAQLAAQASELEAQVAAAAKAHKRSVSGRSAWRTQRPGLRRRRQSGSRLSKSG